MPSLKKRPSIERGGQPASERAGLVSLSTNQSSRPLRADEPVVAEGGAVRADHGLGSGARVQHGPLLVGAVRLGAVHLGPGVPEPERGQDVQRGGVAPAVEDRDLDEQILG